MTRLATGASHLLAIGGRAKSNAVHLQEWQGYQSGLILALQPAVRMAWTCATYQSPPHLCPAADPSFVFKAGTIHNDRLYVCTQTEILIYSLIDFKILHHLSHPWFNDLHHVFPLNDERLLVAVTGLDMVVETDLAGRLMRSWNVIGDPSFSRFPPHLDYRKIPTTKPHFSHPNHIFVLGEEIWVTRFIQRDAVCLSSPKKRIEIGIGCPHDGIVVDQKVYFTTVEGHVVIADRNDIGKPEIFDLNQVERSKRPLGWCRGIKILNEDEIIVGFSRLRPTKWQLGIGVLKSSFNLSSWQWPEPTRLACYNIRKLTLEWEFILEDHQMNAVFSIM
jgi:hypothetical protein